jgi:predicted DNA binding CopG/RHH family protein
MIEVIAGSIILTLILAVWHFKRPPTIEERETPTPFEVFAATAKKPAQRPTEYRQLHVRLSLDDAMRVKHTAALRGYTNQSVLIEAINDKLIKWGEPIVEDFGSAGKKNS